MECSQNNRFSISINTIDMRIILKVIIIYLLFPYLIFAWGWLRLPVAVLFILSMVYSYWRFTSHIAVDFSSNTKGQVGWGVLIIALLVIGIWLLYSGVGHFSDQLYDYKKHNLILNHLINQDWPVIQKITDKNAYVLVYYFAYYLPGAVVGKVLGIKAAYIFQYFFSFIGIALIVAMICQFVGNKKLIWALLVFIFFGGMDILGGLLLNGKIPNLQNPNEWWSTHFIFQGHTEILYWVPQQSIPGWLITAAVLYLILNDRGYKYIAFIWVLSLLWAPWIFIGTIPLLVYYIIINIRDIRRFISWVNIVPVALIGFICAIFYSTNQDAVRNNGWIWETSSNWFPNYVVFILFEFLFLSILIIILNFQNKRIRYLLVGNTIVLSIIPLYHSGVFNDFCMRASIPSLTVLWIFTQSTIFGNQDWKLKKAKNLTTYLVGFSLLTGSIFGIARFISAIERTNSIHGGLFYPYSIPYEGNLYNSFNDIPSDIILEQYLARNVDFRDYQWVFKY